MHRICHAASLCSWRRPRELPVLHNISCGGLRGPKEGRRPLPDHDRPPALDELRKDHAQLQSCVEAVQSLANRPANAGHGHCPLIHELRKHIPHSGQRDAREATEVATSARLTCDPSCDWTSVAMTASHCSAERKSATSHTGPSYAGLAALCSSANSQCSCRSCLCSSRNASHAGLGS